MEYLEKIVGMTLDEAVQYLKEYGQYPCPFLIDGRTILLSANVDLRRVCVEIEEGKISSFISG